MSKRNVRVKSVDVTEAALHYLDEYGWLVDSVLDGVTQEVGDMVAQEIQDNAPVRSSGGGRYKQSITTDWKDVKSKHANKTHLIVHAEAPQYRLTHLLEWGHASKNGGRVEPSPAGGHWKKGEALAYKLLPDKLKEALDKQR